MLSTLLIRDLGSFPGVRIEVAFKKKPTSRPRVVTDVGVVPQQGDIGLGITGLYNPKALHASFHHFKFFYLEVLSNEGLVS
jgi:hypothetical protein